MEAKLSERESSPSMYLSYKGGKTFSEEVLISVPMYELKSC